MIPAIFIGDDACEPVKGTSGTVWPASGYDDPESAEEGAYLFQPDGTDIAYYVDPRRDLMFPPIAGGVR